MEYLSKKPNLSQSPIKPQAKPASENIQKSSAGQSQISKGKIHYDFYQNPTMRSKLRNALGISSVRDPAGKKLSASIERMINRVPDHNTPGVISREELTGREYQSNKSREGIIDNREKSKGGWTQDEVIDRELRKKEIAFFEKYLKEKFGQK